jgi:RNA-binding protein MEX3
MPGSLYSEMEKPSSLEDQRALQLALELSMLGLNGHSGSTDGSTSPDHMSDSALTTLISNGDENRGKKSQNMTECVPVPSSEHVAEIVGRQGELFENRHRKPRFSKENWNP